jgi:hypothetical protein
MMHPLANPLSSCKCNDITGRGAWRPAVAPVTRLPEHIARDENPLDPTKPVTLAKVAFVVLKCVRHAFAHSKAPDAAQANALLALLSVLTSPEEVLVDAHPALREAMSTLTPFWGHLDSLTKACRQWKTILEGGLQPSDAELLELCRTGTGLQLHRILSSCCT